MRLNRGIRDFKIKCVFFVVVYFVCLFVCFLPGGGGGGGGGVDVPTAPRFISNVYTKLANARSHANHVQHTFDACCVDLQRVMCHMV